MLLFEGDIQNWTTEFVVIGAAILLIMLIAILMFKPKKKNDAVKQETIVNQAKPETVVAKEVQKEEVVKTPVEQKQEAPKKETTEVQKEVLETKIQKAKEAPVEVEEKEDEEEEDDSNPDKPKRPAKYHISQNKDTEAEHAGEWRVRKEGSTKTIKYFKTQKEAIQYAEKLAENQDSSIVIHKRDGTIRKQDYSKK